jgi:hypothetical protein
MVFCRLPLIAAAAAEVWLLVLLEMCSEIDRRQNWVELISSLLMFALQGCDETHSQPLELQRIEAFDNRICEPLHHSLGVSHC